MTSYLTTRRLWQVLLALAVALLCPAAAPAQEFFNLTADEVRIDSVVPCFSHVFPLPADYADSVYTVSIDYPEFIDMTEADVARLRSLVSQPLPSLPEVETRVVLERRRPLLCVSFMPMVERDGRCLKLVSFKLSVHAQAAQAARRGVRRAAETASRYADHSVLATGQWAKISVPATGIYQLTEALVRQAGFRNLSRVKIYGYGGALQPEVLDGDYLKATDDLHEVPSYMTPNGRRLFHAVGPVSWSSPTSAGRTRNPYSTVGCYFLTESDDEPLTVDSATFVDGFYPSADDYHYLYENDGFAWYHSGRNLYDSRRLSAQDVYTCELPAHADSGRLTVVLTHNGPFEASVSVNDSVVGTISSKSSLSSQYTYAVTRSVAYVLDGLLRDANTVKLRQTSGTADVRLDYITLTQDTPAPLPDMQAAQFPQPDFVYRITNQDHHADPAADMVIIIPTTQKVLSQAERLKELHQTKDSLRVNIVPADELFNEFSSGTPDANAYRRYLKMLYDRAGTEADAPRYLLLLGDGAWDNRMLSSNWQTTSPDDFLLCYESENSFSATDSYVSDDFFCMLDDGEGSSLARNDMADVGVGRLPARTEAEARIMVDKIVSYRNNEQAGDWQNTLCFMGDDGNDTEGNVHMSEADAAAERIVEALYPYYDVKKYYWDAYSQVTSSTGNRFPDATRLIKQQMQSGALLMDYCGHGAAYSISHEKVLLLSDFEEQTSLRLPLWVTASCDIMPFDTQEANIGETAMLNPKGGAVAFFGTTRTVWTGANMNMNCAFIRYALGSQGAHRYTLGDAVRLAKNDLRARRNLMDRYGEGQDLNKLHYSLLGDPALALATPVGGVVVDSIDGRPVDGTPVQIAAGRPVSVSGHVAGAADFNGVVSLTVKGEESYVVCKLNKKNVGADTAFVFRDRPTTIYNGRDSVSQGRFSMVFVLSKDISYSDDPGQMILYAVSSDKTLTAHGRDENFLMAGNDSLVNDGIGPSIYCYLNSSDFVNGGQVNTTPYFYAELTDKDGINASGSSLGHDLELVVDGDMQTTFNLNEYFLYDFGDYRSGSVGYTLPALAEGPHRLTFRAWDVLNNSSVAELKFNVARSLAPQCFDVTCTRNPATTSTSFIVTHDRTGSTIDVVLQIYDTSGRQLWEYAETGVTTDNTYTLNWDLTVGSGSRLQTGVYLYRVLIGTDGAMQASKAKKLIILNKN